MKRVIISIISATLILTFFVVRFIVDHKSIKLNNDVENSITPYDASFDENLNINIPKDLTNKKICFVGTKCECSIGGNQTAYDNNPKFNVFSYSEANDDYNMETVWKSQ